MAMPAPELLALATALATAISGMLTSEAFVSASVMAVTRWNTVATFCIHVVMATLLGTWASLGSGAVGLLMLSGFFGIIVAAPAYFSAIALLGPRAAVLLFSLSAPLTFVIGALLLGEHPGPQAIVGLVLVLGGIALATWRRHDGPAVSPRLWWLGVGFGLIAALGQASGTVTARPAMQMGADPFAAMAVRFGIGAAVLIALQATPLARTFRASLISVKPVALVVLASLIGNGIGMTLLMLALRYAEAGVVATFAATSPILILPMIWARRGQLPGLSSWLGAGAAVAGTALVLLR